MAKGDFTKEEIAKIEDAIRRAEMQTSGEIRLHVERHCKEDVLDRASGVFDMLEMQKTAERNGVLIYVATKDRKLAILGDAGINAKVEEGFWDSTRDIILSHFKEGKFTEGLSEGISKAGSQLKKHFPYQKGDENELDNEISFGS